MSSRRVVVMSPQTRLARAGRRHRGHWRPSTLDPADAERAVVVYRTQRRRALLAIAVLFALLLGLPALLAAIPWSATMRLADVPVTWLLLAVAPFPLLVLLAVWQLRRAERAEEPAETGAVE